MCTMIRFNGLFRRKSGFETEGSVYLIMWRKFIRSKLNLFFLAILLFVVIISILGYIITPDKTQFANSQHLELALLKPRTAVMFFKPEKNESSDKHGFFRKMLFGKSEQHESIPIYSWHFEGDYIFTERYTGLEPNDGIIVQYHIADLISSVDSSAAMTCINGIYTWKTLTGSIEKMSRDEIIRKIEKEHIIRQKFFLGTDRFGRDVLSQLIIGARVSLSVGFVSVIISLLIGITLGAVSGYFGGITDRFVMWLINVVWAIPSLFLVIAITFALGKGFWQIFFAVGLTLWVEIARLVRGLVITIRNREYVEAAHTLGIPDRRIIMNHILPGTLGPVIVVSASNFASAILIESGLSFLGVGIQPPMPSWGTMLRENYGFLIMDYASLALIPGIAIMLLVLTFMVLGNGLRDAMDVREIH